MKKAAGDIIILHMYTKNENHMRYGSWDTELHRQSFFVILDHFWPFYPPNNPYNQNFEKMKKGSGDAIIFHLCTKNSRLWCMLPEIWSRTDITFCHFEPFFALLPHYWPHKLKFEKMYKVPRDIILLHMRAINEDHMMYRSWDIRRDRQSFFSFWAFFALWPS